MNLIYLSNYFKSRNQKYELFSLSREPGGDAARSFKYTTWWSTGHHFTQTVTSASGYERVVGDRVILPWQSKRREENPHERQLEHQGFSSSSSSSGESLVVPRMHCSVKMWRLVSCAFCLLVPLQPGFWAAAAELEGEVKVEVLFKPLECSPKSKKGDLMNIHYDGFLAQDGSQFYCRSVLQDQVKHAVVKVKMQFVSRCVSSCWVYCLFDLTQVNSKFCLEHNIGDQSYI